MNKLIILFTLLFSNYAFSDCSAPGMDLETHEGEVLGFKLIKLWDEPERKEISKEGDVFIKYGSYGFLLSPVSSQAEVAMIDIDISKIKEMLLGSFVRGEHYLEPMEQKYELSNIKVYDLSNNTKPDLVLFEVSPGANVYSGAVGFIEEKWKTLVTPMCY